MIAKKLKRKKEDILRSRGYKIVEKFDQICERLCKQF